MSTLSKRFGEIMKQHRDERPIAVIADRAACKPRVISNMEAGITLPRLPTYVRICRAYNLTLAQRAELDELAAGMVAKDDDGGEA